MEMRMKNISSLAAWFVFVGFVLTTVLAQNVFPAPAKTDKALVDLNSASAKELEALPGVGPATSKKIIANRPYKSVDELSKAGLSEKVIEKLKPLVTVGSTTPAGAASATTAPSSIKKSLPSSTKLAPGQKVNINTASKEQLDALPGIGSTKAQAIIDGRPYEKIEDIMKVKGIKQGVFNKIKDLITVK